MYPVLFHIGRFPVPTYGVIALLAAVASVMLVRRYARVEGLDPVRMGDSVILIALVGLVGARLLELFVMRDEILADPGKLRTLIFSGGVFYGGVIAAVLFGVWWYRHLDIPVFQGLDLIGLVGAISMAIARWGCFFSGCCYGKGTDLPWGVRFPEAACHLHAGLRAAQEKWEYLHPTQVYLSLNALAILVVLLLLYRRKRFHGQIIMVYLGLYAVTRFFIEYLRGDRERGDVIEGILSTSQFIGIFILAAAVWGYLALRRRHIASGEPDWSPAKAPARKK